MRKVIVALSALGLIAGSAPALAEPSAVTPRVSS